MEREKREKKYKTERFSQLLHSYFVHFSTSTFLLLLFYGRIYISGWKKEFLSSFISSLQLLHSYFVHFSSSISSFSSSKKRISLFVSFFYACWSRKRERKKKERFATTVAFPPSFLHPSPFLSFSPFETKPFETEDALETEEREPIEKPRKKGKRWGCAGGWKESEERKRRGERKRKEARRGEEDEGARNERERPRRAASGRRASRRRVKTERRRRSSQSASASRRDVLASWWLLRRFYPSFSYPSWASPMLGSTNHRILRVVAILRRFSWTAIVANKICSISNYRIISSLRGKLRHAFVQKKRGSIWVALRLPHSLPVYREKIYRSIECEIKSENYRALCDR